MFVDNLMIFGEVKIGNLETTKHILIYSSWSGQMINFSKSSIFSLIISRIVLKKEVAGMLRAQFKKSKCYLGAPLFVSSRSVSGRKYLIEKMHCKLKGWKSSLLTHAGREVLIKSSLAGIPIFQMGINLSPKQCVKRWRELCGICIGYIALEASSCLWRSVIHHKLVFSLRTWVYTGDLPPIHPETSSKVSFRASMAPKKQWSSIPALCLKARPIPLLGAWSPHTQSIASTPQKTLAPPHLKGQPLASDRRDL